MIYKYSHDEKVDFRERIKYIKTSEENSASCCGNFTAGIDLEK